MPIVSKIKPTWSPAVLSCVLLCGGVMGIAISPLGAQESSTPESVSGSESAVKDVAEGADGDKVEKDATESKVKEPEYEPKSKAVLRRELSTMQYKVTQSEGTEPAFRNLYWNNKKSGLYRCIVCEQSLFTSETKYKSGTGWPSFYAPIKADHVGYKDDHHFFYTRTEVHCSRCNAHLGHVFNDGPQDKTGKRYCMNSAALKFFETGRENDFED